MPTYNVLVDDDFNRTATSFGSGANSTTGVGSPVSGHFSAPSVGGAWIDLVGNEFNISAPGTLNTAGAISNTYDVTHLLYRPAVENTIDGRVRVWATGTSTTPAAIFRYVPASGGSGYDILSYQTGGFYGTKRINGAGAQGNMFTGMTATFVGGNTAVPSAYVFEVLTSTTGTATTFTMKYYAQTDTTFSNPLTTNTYVDTDATLSVLSGSLGTSSFNPTTFTRVQTAKFSTAPTPLTSGGATVAAYKTKAVATGGAATGGTSPYTYQWFKSLVSGNAGTAISGATSLTFSDTGISPATTYYYTLVSTDSVPATVSSNQALGTTLAANAVLIGFIGDSISYGSGSTSAPAADPIAGTNAISKELAYLIAHGQPASGYDQAIPGTKASDWLAGGANLPGAMAVFQNAQVTHISYMIGTNDSGAGSPVPASAYQISVQSTVNTLLATFPGVKIVLNDSPWIDISQAYAAAWGAGADPLLQTYRLVNAALANGNNILLGDTASYAFFQSNPTQLADGIHPNVAGHASLGTLWGIAFIQALSGSLSVISFDPNEHTVTIGLNANTAIVARHVSDQQIVSLRLAVPSSEKSVVSGLTTILTSL